LADLNGDGKRDMVSGSWPGMIYFFAGTADDKFLAPLILRTTDGKPMRPGKATAVAAADWDRDGDVDLLIGTQGGRVVFAANEGNAPDTRPTGASGVPKFAEPKDLMLGGKPLDAGHDAGPCVADWDRDGIPDLLVGNADGEVRFYRNTKATGAPELTTAVEIVPTTAMPDMSESESRPSRPAPVCGARTKVSVGDWNGDGHPDLLVGDVNWAYGPKPKQTAEEKAEDDKAEKEVDKLYEQQSKFRSKVEAELRKEDRFSPNRTLSEVEDDEFFEETFRRLGKIPEYAALEAQMKPLWEIRSKYRPKIETHGYVWVYLRKAPTRGN
jgi:hypothetical protein